MAKNETTLTPRRDTRDPFALMRAEFDRFFNAPGWAGLHWPTFRFGRGEDAAWNPGIDVFERDNRLVTKIDLPGLKKEDIKVEVTDGYLTISGDRKKDVEEKDERFYRIERSYGVFTRSIRLPFPVDDNKVNAVFKNGVLTIAIPKAESSKGIFVPIKIA